MRSLVLIKVGGALITDKNTPRTIRKDVMQSVAEEIKRAIDAYPNADFIIGNGAGSFGHHAALKYAGKPMTEEGRSEIHQAAVELNAIFVQVLVDTGISASTVTPASCVVCDKGVVIEMDTEAVTTLLSNHTTPILFGDIVPDTSLVGTILSTETLLYQLAERFQLKHDSILTIYMGDTEGVLDEKQNTIPTLNTRDLKGSLNHIKGASGFDVTGGMRQKVEEAFKMAHIVSRVYIVSGREKGVLSTILRGGDSGTRVTI